MATLLLSKLQSLIDFIAYYDFDNDDDNVTIKGLIFDFGSVLCHSTKQSVRTLMQNGLHKSVQKQFNLTTDQSNEFLAEFKNIRAEFKERKLFLGTGTCFDEGFVVEYTLQQMVKDALHRIGIDASTESDIENVCASYRRPCIDAAQMIDGVLPFLSWCKRKGIRCGICSNYFDSSRTKQMLKKFQIFDFFDIVIISADAKYRKPDVRIIEPILCKWSDLSLSQIVFAGDNVLRDTLLPKYCNIRSILCRFTQTFKERKQPNIEQTKQRLQSDSFVSFGADITTKCVSKQIGYDKSEQTVTEYIQMPNALRKISSMPFVCRPLVVGLFILPHKVSKFTKRNVFFMQHRKDLLFKQINFKQSLFEQGPFDIFIHKIASWQNAAKYDETAKKQLNDCLHFINCNKTNLKHKLKGFGDEILAQKTQKYDYHNNKMFVTDSPYFVQRTCARMEMYQRINNAQIQIDGIQFRAPKFMTIKNETIKSLNLNEIKQTFVFPLIAKPRFAVSPVFNGTKNLKSCAHSMYILPNASMICDALSSFKSENDQKTDWILQQYINHSGCHKVYVVDNDVFVTINDSTPSIECIEKKSNFTLIDTGNYSKHPLKDQSATKMKESLYKRVSMGLKEAFGLNCFGFDLLFDDDDDTKAYIVDINYLPGYKSVPNFSAIFWGFVLNKYFEFINDS